MNKIRYVKLCIALMAMLLLLTSCWNRRELNDMSIASALGFDKKGDGYEVAVQIINAGEIASGKGGGGQRMPVVTQQLIGGHTIFESVRAMTTMTPRKIYASHIRVLVIGEQLAKEGIADVLDFLSRDHEFRTDFYILVAKGATAADVLQVLTPLEKIPSNKLFEALETSEQNWGVTSTVDLHELIFDIVSKGKEPALTSIQIVGNAGTAKTKKNLETLTPAAFQRFNGLAVFRQDKLVGYLSTKESKGYSYVLGHVKNTVVRASCPDGGDIAIELNRIKPKVRGSVSGGQPAVEVAVKLEGNVGEVVCGIDLEKTDSIAWLEEAVNEEVRGTIEASVKKAKAFRSDIFGFGNAVHRADSRAWRELQKDWEDEFPDLKVDVTVETELRRTGTVVQSFIKELKD
ncbi:Ger(x)C family spore germination protein [Paenibacillus sp. PL2-23]|uniref:Ger(x)C family spore germination protein n=1 Tax=Paenibacillus sp. PL2-23 TaxID=2100729 RepID=UPI0030F75334